MKYIISFTFLLTVYSVTAQDKYIFKYRTDTVYKKIIYDDGSETGWSGIEDHITKGFLVVLDLTHLKVSMYLKKTATYSIAKLDDHFTKDDNGEYANLYCVDDDNKECVIMYRIPNDGFNADALIYLKYPNYWFCYVLKK